jgi:hypothetical protein
MSKDTSALMSRFIGEPSSFGGEAGEDAFVWLRSMNRIRRGAGLLDDQALLVAGSHLRGMAETWWSAHEESVKTWKEFESLLVVKFAYKQDMAYWEEIQDVSQGPNDTVEDVAFRLKYLFGKVKSSNSTLMIRTLLKAINPDVAKHVEQNGLSADFDDVAEKAATVDRVNRKYGAMATGQDDGGSLSTRYFSSVNVAAAVKNDAIEELSKMVKELASTVADIKTKQEAASVSASTSTFVSAKVKPKSPIVCWNCDEVGHVGKACPHPMKSKQENSSGKDQERQ